MPIAPRPTPRRAVAALVCTAVVGIASGCGQGAPVATTSSPTQNAPTASSPTTTQAPTGPTGPSPASGTQTTETAHASPLASAADVPVSGSGRTTPVEVPGADSQATGRTVRYSVEVEGELEELAQGFPEKVREILTDERGWETKDHVHFVHVTPAEQKAGARVDVRILFASPTLVDRKCAPLRTNGRLSCHSDGEVLVNAWRWVHGADTFGGDLATYRLYLVNHEVGHSIGHPHQHCPGPGRPAPVMLQQTIRLDGCTPQPWPTA